MTLPTSQALPNSEIRDVFYLTQKFIDPLCLSKAFWDSAAQKYFSVYKPGWKILNYKIRE
jgi:hypothetical protein